MVLQTSIEFPDFSVEQTFNRFTKEIIETLSRKGVTAHFGKSGKLEAELGDVARITGWNPPRSIALDWWLPETRGEEFVTTVKISFEPLNGSSGSRIVIEHEGWENVLSKTRADPVDWFADVVAGPLLAASTPQGYGEWLVNRVARKPSGTASREHYSNPIYHKPNFEGILGYLNLNSEDYLVEIGCGGGYFLAEALKSGCRAAAIDHSPDMVEVARNLNSGSINEGRLDIVEGDAEALPFDDEQFTCAVSTGVFHFIEHPPVFFSEAYRVLKRDGRFILFIGSKKIRGTPAEPDPIAYDYFRYYDDGELIDLATSAGFIDARVEHPDQKEFAIKAGIPEEQMDLFSDPSFGQFLIAYKR